MTQNKPNVASSASATPTRPAIGVDDDCKSIAQLLDSKQVTLAQVVGHLTREPYPVTDIFAHLSTRLDGATLGQIVVAQQAIAIAAAEKRGAASVNRSKSSDVTMAVGQSGTLVVRGLGRNPQSAYKNQWHTIATKLLGLTDDQWQSSPMGQFIASDPTATYSVADDYLAYDSEEERDDNGKVTKKAVTRGADKVAEYRSGSLPWVSVSGDIVTVHLSTAKD